MGLSIIWISFFYIIKTISDMLGENGILNEWYAVGIPFLLFFLISIFTLWKNR
jgi:lipopolysaccharide export LptBFGC system permease protein LptF